MSDLISRATQAFLLTQDNQEQPFRGDSSVESHDDGTPLVVLRNARGVLAIHRYQANHDRPCAAWTQAGGLLA